MICPTSTASPYEITSACDVCGSRVVVTPYARLAVYMYGCGECTPHCGHMCACTSINPGMIVLPDTSITRAPPGTFTLPCAPTPTMRLPVTTTSPRAITSSPFMVMMRAPRSTTVPVGRSLAAVTVTSMRVASYTGLAKAAAGPPVPAPAPAGRSGALNAESAASESARATSYWKNARPSE